MTRSFPYAASNVTVSTVQSADVVSRDSSLALSGVRYRDFLLATVGMLPAIVMYVYYGKIVGDVAKIAAGVAPPRGVEYWIVVSLGLVATIVATTMITRAARRAIAQQQAGR